MRLSVSLLAWLATLCAAKDAGQPSPFYSPSALIEALPVFYDISDVNLVEANHALDSFWAVNYIRTTNNRSFLLNVNALVRNGSATQRAGIMSLDNPSVPYPKNYQNVGQVKNNNGTLDPFNLTMPGGRFGLETTGQGAASSSKEAVLPPMRIFSHHPGTEFDIDLDFQGPVLLNAGLGSWRWGGGIQHQVSLPEARPRGTFVVDNITLTIDPRHSVTWYDRQWGPTQPDHFTWFGLYLTDKTGTESYISIWDWEDEINGNKTFVTMLDQDGANTALPVLDFQRSTDNVFHSKATGVTYVLQHNITLADGSELIVTAAQPDQEYVMDGTTVGFYSGYVEVSGDYMGHGAMDIMPPM
ncbi:uncharacterized protein BDV14DRAFT_209428 [Aspergillus stella-maris]|uniref:uncharacterized protein n=1 Tax=Aspergillus stella-maris TaxID=1810926 RepID=UPI003CCDAEB3